MKVTELWKPSDPAFISDPYPAYEKITQSFPVFKANTGDYVIANYADAKALLADRDCKSGVRAGWVKRMTEYASGKGINLSIIRAAVSSMLIETNPPDHTAVRAVFARDWPSTTSLKNKAEEICQEIWERLPASFDAVTEISRKLPVFMISDVIGLKREEGLKYVNDGFTLVQLLNPYLTFKDLLRIRDASVKLYSFFEDFLSEVDVQEENLAASLKRLVRNNRVETLDPVSSLTFLFVAGFETTSTLITLCLDRLLSDRMLADQMENDQQIENYVKEIVRLYSPAQLVGRVNGKRMVLSGIEIPENSMLTISLGAANRDPRHFENPHQIDLNRTKYDHLAFGYGMHHCLGSQMAQVEAGVAVKTFLPMIKKASKLGELQSAGKYAVKSYQSMKLQVGNNEG